MKMEKGVLSSLRMKDLRARKVHFEFWVHKNSIERYDTIVCCLESLSKRHKNIVRFQLYRTQNPGKYRVIMTYFETTLTRMLESQGHNGLSISFVKKAALQVSLLGNQ